MQKKIIEGLNQTINQKKITIFGWAFKKDTNDTRESAAIYVAQRLLEEGALLQIYDPMVDKAQILYDMEELWRAKEISLSKKQHFIKQIKVYRKHTNAILDSSAVVILTEWDEFIGYDWDYIKSKLVKPIKIFDGRNILELENVNYIGK